MDGGSNIVQETGFKTICMKKIAKDKMAVWGSLTQIVEEKIEAKGKGERGR